MFKKLKSALFPVFTLWLLSAITQVTPKIHHSTFTFLFSQFYLGRFFRKLFSRTFALLNLAWVVSIDRFRMSKTN